MSGSKKSSGPAIPPLPPALPGPALTVPPTPQPVPGHLELLSQQLHQGFPSLGQADLLKSMQSTYRPATGPDPATAAAVATAKAAPMARGSSVALPGDRGYRGGMINSFSDFAALIAEARRRKAGG